MLDRMIQDPVGPGEFMTVKNIFILIYKILSIFKVRQCALGNWKTTKKRKLHNSGLFAQVIALCYFRVFTINVVICQRSLSTVDKSLKTYCAMSLKYFLKAPWFYFILTLITTLFTPVEDKIICDKNVRAWFHIQRILRKHLFWECLKAC